MKIAVLTDIHANLIALEAVTAHLTNWRPDRVFVAGDIVNRGPRPLECWQFIQARVCQDGWQVIRGNHEDYVLSQAEPDAPRSGPAFTVHQASYWTMLRMKSKIADLRALPEHISLAGPDAGEVRIVHASMRGNRDGIYPETSNQTLRRQIQPAPQLMCVGHTHRALVRTLDDTLVVNAGSSGLPFDGDTRPSYAQIMWNNHRWQAHIQRVEYDVARAARDFTTSGYMEAAGPLTQLVFVELTEAVSMLYGWSVRYQQAILDGRISMPASVEAYLRDPWVP